MCVMQKIKLPDFSKTPLATMALIEEPDESVLKYAVIDADVYAMCIQHALSTSKEEIMGLLIGQVENQVSYIKAYLILTRSDKQPDRVEVSAEQLSFAEAYVEELKKKLNSKCRILGWYHSHPHITVWPSNVDVATQLSYQRMDKFFVGLIFSVFQSSANSGSNKISICCFQSLNTSSPPVARHLDLHVAPSSLKLYNLEACLRLPKALYEEELKSFNEQIIEEVDNLTIIHNETVNTAELGHILSYVAKPLAIDLGERLIMVKKRIAALEKLKAQLTAQM